MWDVGCVVWLLRRRRSALRDCYPTTTSCWVLTMDLYCPQKLKSDFESALLFWERVRARLRAIAASFVFAPPFKFQFVLLSLVPLLSSPSVAPDRWHFSLRCPYNLQHNMKLANSISKPFLQNDDNIQQNKQNLYRLWPFGNLCSCPESKSKCRRSWFLHLILDGYRQFVSLPRRHPSQSDVRVPRKPDMEKGALFRLKIR